MSRVCSPVPGPAHALDLAVEAHAWTLPQRTQRRLSPPARRLLGLPFDHFLLHAHRIATLPRSPLAAARFLWDALVYGYTPYVHPQILRNGMRAMGLPEWQQTLALHPIAQSLAFQMHRWLVLVSLGAPLLVARCCARARSTQAGASACEQAKSRETQCVATSTRALALARRASCWLAAPPVLSTLSLLIGLLLGINLTLERVRM